MIWPFPGNTLITTPWDDPRPVGNPGKHVHGGIDIGCRTGSRIVAPEDGGLCLYYARRMQDGQYWPAGTLDDFPFRNYFYDMFGGVAVLRGSSGKTHVFTHLYAKQMNNNARHDWAVIEEPGKKRFPLLAHMAGEIRIRKGEFICYTGDSGFSSGPHCHYEIHDGFKWQDWGERPDPEKIDWEEFR